MALQMKDIFIASDHAGVELKASIIKAFPRWNWTDYGPETTGSVDYPDYADLVCRQLQSEDQWGVLICGSGQGMSMRANKFSHIRAALVYDITQTELCRAHNNANVICLGSRYLELRQAISLLQAFFSTAFLGERHARRVTKISSPT